MKSLSHVLQLLLLAAVAVVSAISSAGDRLLVVLDSVADKAEYSQFLGDLESRGFAITYDTPKSTSLTLFRHGERTYDHVLFFPVKAKGLGPNLTAEELVKFIDAKGNILVTLSSSSATPSSLVSLLAELDMQLPAERTGLVVDHFNHDVASAAELHDVVLVPARRHPRDDVKDLFYAGAGDALIAFPRGVGVVLGNGELLAPITRAPRTAYMYSPKEQADTVDDVFGAGDQLVLAAAMQARNSARLALLGSAEMLRDAWFDASVKTPDGRSAATWNRHFARRVSGWTFQETGVLRVNWVEHHLVEPGAGNASNPRIYRIKNDVKYTVSLSEYDWDKWIAFDVPANDALQLEFSMLSPFHRLALHREATPSAADATAAAYSASFRLPDQHGIFNFLLDYKRPFLTSVEEKNTVSVRHMAHDEWPRSFVISGAWPWIAGIATTVSAWLAFCALWMYSRPTDAKRDAKKTQ